MNDRSQVPVIVIAFALVIAGIVWLGVRLEEAESRQHAVRASAMGRTFQLNGHAYTSIGSTFGGKVECVSSDAPTQYLSVAAVLALAGQTVETP